MRQHLSYFCEEDAAILEWFDAIGRRRGLLQNEVDYEAVIELLINDLRNAKMGTYCFDLYSEMKRDIAHENND